MSETKSISYKVAGDDSLGNFSGDAATYGNVDLIGDVVLPGAFNKCIAEKGTHYPLLWAHDMNEVIGSFDVVDTEKSLEIKGSFNMDVQRGREGYALLKRGDLKGLSIGYSVKDWSYDNEGHRLLKEIELFEVSLVAIPCNPEASAEAKTMQIKSGKLSDLDEESRAAFIGLVKEAIAEIENEEDEPQKTDDETKGDEEETEEQSEENDEETEAKTVHDITVSLREIFGR